MLQETMCQANVPTWHLDKGRASDGVDHCVHDAVAAVLHRSRIIVQCHVVSGDLRAEPHNELLPQSGKQLVMRTVVSW